jgi:hypothetical protein
VCPTMRAEGMLSDECCGVALDTLESTSTLRLAASSPRSFQLSLQQMGEQFPEIVKKEQDVKEILDEEEEAFARTSRSWREDV